MAKYIKLNSAGDLAEEVPVNTSTGATDAGKIVELDASGKLSATMLPIGIGQDAISIVVGTSVVAGDFINVYDNTGTPNIRPADNTVPYTAHGFVLESVTANGSDTATVYFEGTNTGVSGLTPGVTYFLSSTGDVDTYAGVTKSTGDVAQKLGVAITSSSMSFEYTNPIILA
jgi:hypothetical protein